MTAYGFDTRAALLKSGKTEFLEHGFEGASMRAICAGAHVTTGAFYSNFKAKEDLFHTIIEEDLREYNAVYDGLLERIIKHDMANDDGENKVMDFVMEHRDLFKLLFDCSQGTSYAGFKDRLLAKFDRTYQEFFDSYASEPVDPEVVRIIVRMKFAQYCEMLYGDYSRERARYLTDRIEVFTRAGFEALLDVRFASPG